MLLPFIKLVMQILSGFNKNRWYTYSLKSTLKNEGFPVVKIGIGINTGEVIAGKIGSIHRMEYNVIGEAVNFCARVEKTNKILKTQILISNNTAKILNNSSSLKAHPYIGLKGISKPVTLYTFKKKIK